MRTTADSPARFADPRGRSIRKNHDGLGPLVRVFIVLVGTAVGCMLIPADAQSAGAMKSSAMVLTFALLLIPGIEAVRYGFKSALKIRNLLLVGLVYWLLADLIQGLYEIEATPTSIEIAFLSIGVFATATSIGGAARLIGLPSQIQRLIRVEMTNKLVLATVVFCFVTGIFYYVYKAHFSWSLIIEGLFYRSRFAAPWMRGALGDMDSFIEQLSYFGYLLLPLTVIMYVRRGMSVGTVFCAVLSLCHMLFVAQTGARTMIGAIIGSAIIVAALLTRRTINAIHLIAFVAAIIFVQVLMNFVLENRGSGLATLETQDSTFSTVKVDDNFNRLAQTIDFIPSVHPYSGLQFLYSALVRPIPRALWPGKPVDAGFDLSEQVGAINTSLTVSVIGEAYAGFGLALVFVIGLFFGALARWWEQTLEDHPTSVGVMLYSIGGMALFTALRAFVNIVLLSYPILSLWAVFALFRLGDSNTVPGRDSR